MRFEVYVPRLGKKELWVKLLLEADHWSHALKSGLLRLGEDGRAVESAVCEVRPEGVLFVRDLQHHRTFLLRELPAGPETPVATVPLSRPRPEPGCLPADEPGLSAAARGVVRAGQVVTVEAEVALPFPLPASSGPQPLSAGPLDSLLPQVLQEVDQVARHGRDLRAAAGYVLDLAMGWIPSESGSVLFTHANRQDLCFVAARGPKAREVMAFRVPLGQGIVGFCAAEGTCLAVNDVRNDPRFFARISQALGHEVATLMAAPIMAQGQVFGAIELINHLGPTRFSEEELRLLSVIGLRLAEYLVTLDLTG